MTIAHKTKSKVTKVFKKYGSNICVTNKDNIEIAKFGILTNANFKRNIKGYKPVDLCATNIEQLLLANLRIAKKQIVRRPCVFCGDENSQRHHVKHVRKVL